MPEILDLSLLRPGDLVFTREPSKTSRLIRFLTCGSYSHAAIIIYPDIWYETDGAGSGFRFFTERQETQLDGETHVVVNPRPGAMTVLRVRGKETTPLELLSAIKPSIALPYPPLIDMLPICRFLPKKMTMFIARTYHNIVGDNQTPYCSQLIFRIICDVYGLNFKLDYDHISPRQLHSLVQDLCDVVTTNRHIESNRLTTLGSMNNSLNTVINHLSQYQTPHSKKDWEKAMLELEAREGLDKGELTSSYLDKEKMAGLRETLTNPDHFRLHEYFWTQVRPYAAISREKLG